MGAKFCPLNIKRIRKISFILDRDLLGECGKVILDI